ncbi:MAG TPA: hypothetical protein VF715_15470 [Thermoleophilaceae bacterium]|jgi:hypothetical protein
MKVRLLLTAFAVAGLMAVLPAAPAAAASKCSGKGAKGIISTSSARVFTLPASGGQERKAYACLYSQNKRRFLGWIQECQNMTAASGFVLSGKLVGYVETVCGLIAGDQSVVVRDIKTGKIVRSANGASGTSAPNEESSTYVTDMAMNRDGGVVWIGEFDANSGGVNGPGDNRQVWAMPGSTPQLMESSLEIVPGTLALGPTTSQGFNWFYWQSGSQARAGKLE